MATNLNQYYTGIGQALPSVQQRASTYSSLGLGSGYAGTAAQNAALLAKLSGGSAPSGNAAGSSSNPNAAKGYNSIPTGNPQPVSNDPGLNDLTAFASQNRTDRQALIDRLTAQSQGAFDQYAGETGLTGANATLKAIQDQMASTGTQIADTPLNVTEGVRGTFANDTQRQTEIGSDLMPLQALYSKVASALPGASTAQQNALQAVQAKLGVLQQQQQLAISGFDTSSQNELAAIQAKVARGQSLTDQEFARETQLSAAKIAAQAQMAGANATVKSAEIGAKQSGINAALQFPGVSATQQPNGSWSAALPAYLQNLSGTQAQPSVGSGLQGGSSTYNPATLQGVIDKYK